VIGRYGEEAEEVAVAVGCGSAGLGNAEGVDGGDAWWWSGLEYLFPLQALVAVDLIPGHSAELLECLHCGVAVVLFKVQEIIQKPWTVDIEYDPASVLSRHSAFRRERRDLFRGAESLLPRRGRPGGLAWLFRQASSRCRGLRLRCG